MVWVAYSSHNAKFTIWQRPNRSLCQRHAFGVTRTLCFLSLGMSAGH
jgi:hypothetical protein